MTDIGELVNIVAFGSDVWECPFTHKQNATFSGSNVMPPVDGKKTNDADELGRKLASQSANMVTLKTKVTVGARTTSHDVQYTPHHLIPGNESWPETKLLRWVDDHYGHIIKDINYKVNDASNGVDLPGIHGIGNTAWSAKSPNFQREYAFAAMRASIPRRQFHDRHPKYSSFVVNSLDAIAAKLDKTNLGAMPGCGKPHCGGDKPTKPFDPPVGLLERLEQMAERLEGYLTGAARGWRKPLFTSRFALMYKNKKLDQDEARDQIAAVTL